MRSSQFQRKKEKKTPGTVTVWLALRVLRLKSLYLPLGHKNIKEPTYLIGSTRWYLNLRFTPQRNSVMELLLEK